MASIQALPPELVLPICEFLARDVLTLKALCLTSRTIGPLAQDVLYRHIVFRKPEHRIWPLIRTFIDEPHLAQKVKVLTHSLEIYQQHEENPPNSARLEHCDFVRKLALHLSLLLPESPWVIGHILASIPLPSNQNSMAALLFLLLPRLKELDLIAWYRPGEITSPGLVESIYGPLLTIVSDPELRHVTNRLDEVRKLTVHMRLFRLLSFFDFKSLDTLVVNLVEHEGNAQYLGDPAEFLIQTMNFPRLRYISLFTTLQELEDDPSWPREDAYLLPYIIGAICAPSHSKPTQNRLQCLELKLCGLKTSWENIYSLKPIISALQSMKDSLTDLRILLPCGLGVRSKDLDIFRYVASIPSMSQFSQLLRLAVPPDFLIHRSFRKPPHRQIDFTRILPASLMDMNLIYPGGIIIPWLQGLSYQVQEFPNLKFIYLRCIPQRDRSASWFQKDDNVSTVFKTLKSHGISVNAADVDEGPPPRKDSNRGDILDVHDGALVTDELGRRIPHYEAE